MNTTVTEFGEPFELDPYLDNRLRSDRPITLLGFIDLLISFWKKADHQATIVRHAPFGEDIHFPLITYRMIKKTINPEFKDIKPRYRTTIRHPYMPDEFIELRGQMYDVLLEFNIFAMASDEADALVEELDDFIMLYKGFFKQQGVQEILFFAQGGDQVITDYKFPIAYRPIQYTVRIEKITPIFLSTIEQIATSIAAYNPASQKPI